MPVLRVVYTFGHTHFTHGWPVDMYEQRPTEMKCWPFVTSDIWLQSHFAHKIPDVLNSQPLVYECVPKCTDLKWTVLDHGKCMRNEI